MISICSRIYLFVFRAGLYPPPDRACFSHHFGDFHEYSRQDAVSRRLLRGCIFLAGGVAAQAAETRYPLTLKNCGRDVTFKQAPARAVAVGQSSTEILYSLGLGDKVVGTAVWFGPVLKGFEEVNAKVKRLADNDPSFESVLAQKPDIVTADFQWHVGPTGIVAKPEQFEELGIPAYTSPSDCVGKDNSGGGDGVRTAAFKMDIVYQEITELAQIFDVQDRGEKLVADLKAREAAAREKLGLRTESFRLSSGSPARRSMPIPMSQASSARPPIFFRRSASRM